MKSALRKCLGLAALATAGLLASSSDASACHFRCMKMRCHTRVHCYTPAPVCYMPAPAPCYTYGYASMPMAPAPVQASMQSPLPQPPAPPKGGMVPPPPPPR